NAADIQRAWEALKYAQNPRIHVFLATSEVHMQCKLRMTEEEVLAKAVEGVKMAKAFCHDVEFSAEDASRSEPAFLYKVLQKVIQAGASVVNIPDTVGYIMPYEFEHMIRDIKENVPNIHKAKISVHCHNDLGMAVANSLAAVRAGAAQVECTINGLGERAGNASLEEIIMSLETRNDFYDVEHHINTRQIYRTSHLISNYAGFDVQPNKAIVGSNAFLHESGIHQHGVLQERSTYEIMNPQSIGLYSIDGMVLGKLSGRHAFEEKIKELGYHLDGKDLNEAFAKFKALADRKKDITLKDIEAILEGSLLDVPALIFLEDYQIFSGKYSSSTATITLSKGEE
ncbi:MAG: 2-isopropylmalate synthase, partial [Clostridiales bacterium]